MVSEKRTSSPNRGPSFSAESMQSTKPANMEDAAVVLPTATTNIHQNETESKDPSPPSTMPPSGERKVSATADEKPFPQGVPQTESHAPSNPAGVNTARSSARPPKEGESRRFLGIPAYQGHSYGDRSYDYMQKYPPDAPGRELDPDARVWKVYLDEAESYDNDMIKSFRDTIDSLLVFAALFSSIVSGFVGQTSQALEPDYAQIGVSLLFEQIEVLRAAGNATRIEEIPRSPLTPDSITHSSRDVAINWLFFASLAFSLATAFVAVLIKQWLQAFTALIPGDAKRRSLTRQFRFTGLIKWKLPEIINILPLFLHLALALFLVGLCLFVSQFHPSITVMVGVVSCAAIAFYIITGALPAVHLDCPYRLPLLFIPACLVVWTAKMAYFKISKLYNKLKPDPHFNPNPPRLSLASLHSQEQAHVSWSIMTWKLEGLSLAWLFSLTPDTSVQRVTLHGVSRLLQSDNFQYLKETRYRILRSTAISLRDSLPWESMSSAAIEFLTPTAQLEDAPLLRDVILSSRQICDRPLLFEWNVDYVLDSPYARNIIEHNALAHSRPGWNIHPEIFYSAIDKDKWDVVMYLLDSSLDHVWDWRLNGCQVLAFASVSEAIAHDDWATIFSIAKEKGIDFNAFHFAEYSLSTALHLVSSYGTVAALQHLISNVPNLDCNVADRFGSTPLHYACDRGKDYPKYERHNSDTPFWILGRFADENGVNFKKPAPLITQTLLLEGADPNIVDEQGCLPLHNACSNGFLNFGCTEEGLKVIEALLTATKNINHRSNDGFTPLDLLEKSDRRDTEEGNAGYSLMRKHGAQLAGDLAQVEVDNDTEEGPC